MGSCASSNASAAKEHDVDYKMLMKDKLLGGGITAEVWLAKYPVNNRKYALKITKPSIRQPPNYVQISLQNEVDALKSVQNHPNILRYHTHWIDPEEKCEQQRRKVDVGHVVTELCKGGELWGFIANAAYGERVARDIVKMLVSAVAHCHSKGVVHRDLKPENCLFRTKEREELVLVDFGLARHVKDSKRVYDACGSPFYIAPEVLDKDFPRTGQTWKASDVWSIGVISYLLVFGLPPFTGQTKKELFENIKNGKFSLSEDIFNCKRPKSSDHPLHIQTQENARRRSSGRDFSVSVECKDFITQCLNTETSERMTSKAALKHPWMSAQDLSEAPNPELVSRLIRFHDEYLLKKNRGARVSQR